MSEAGSAASQAGSEGSQGDASVSFEQTPSTSDSEAFKDLCTILNLDEETRAASWQTWQETMAEGSGLNTVKPLMIAILYFEGRVKDEKLQSSLTACKTINGITVSHLLRAGGMNMVDFFGVLKTVIAKREGTTHAVPEVLKKGVTSLQRKFCVLTALYQKFEKVFNTIFKHEGPCSRSKVGREPTATLMAYLWTLFVVFWNHEVSKGTVGQDALVMHYELLLCCISYCIAVCAPSILADEFVSLSLVEELTKPGADKKELDAKRLIIVSKVCTALELSTDQAKDTEMMYQDFWTPFCEEHSKSDKDDFLTFLLGNVPPFDSLNKVYDALYMTHCDFDERLWLNGDAQVRTPSKPTVMTPASALNGTSPAQKSLQKRFIQEAMNVAHLSTPVRSAMRSVESLQSIFAKSGDKVTPNLTRFFNSCDTDPSELVNEIIQNTEIEFSRKYVEAFGKQSANIAEKRMRNGRQLYFRILETMLTTESERLHQNNFSTMLNNIYFHKSLLACCLEIVIFTYSIVWGENLQGDLPDKDSVGFPWVLTVVDIHAYDFFKVIESVVRSEKSLPSEITKHLHDVESQILLCFAWRADSPLWAQLEANTYVPTHEQTRPGLLTTDAAESDRPLNSHVQDLRSSPAFQMYLSPRKPPRKLESTAISKLPKSRSIGLFFRKMYRLAESHLRRLLDMLKLPSTKMAQIWTCFEHAVTQHPSLLKSRHLDQILLCSIYGICKVSGAEGEDDVPFKLIKAKYSAMASKAAHHDVCRDVYIGQGKSGDFGTDRVAEIQLPDGMVEFRGNIIRFYNLVFMPMMKSYMLKYSSQEQPILSEPPPPRHEGLPQVKVPGSQLFLSPLRHPRLQGISGTVATPHSPLPGQMSPRTRALYSFGSPRPQHSRSDLDSINRKMKTDKAASSKRQFESGGSISPRKRLHTATMRRKLMQIRSEQAKK